MADLEEVANLLHVHEKAAAHGELLKNIADLAMARLKAINDEHLKTPLVQEPEPEPGIPRPALELSEPEPKPTMRRV